MDSVTHILSIAMEAGKIMLENGAEIYRVEDTMARISKYYGAKDQHFFVLTNVIHVYRSRLLDCEMILISLSVTLRLRPPFASSIRTVFPSRFSLCN